jgi:4-hydroxy-tetrahydrodipicolinate synthase
VDQIDKEKFKGIIVPLSTPLNNDYSFDSTGMEKLIEHVIKAGVDGVFVLGSCGEYPSFDDKESIEIVNFVIEKVNHRIPVYAHATRNSTMHTQRIAKAFTEAGADYIVLATPFYSSSITQDDLKEHFKTIASEYKVVLYNQPKTTKINIEVSTLEELARTKNIIGVKESSANFNKMKETTAIIPVLQGSDELILESMKLGAKGGVPGLANVFPGLFVKLYNAYQEGREQEAERFNLKIKEASSIIYKTPKNAQVGVKQGLNAPGICSSLMRPPTAQINDEEAKKINQYVLDFRM